MDVKCKVSKKWINNLKDNEIFVFGSNTSGRHGLGGAKTAMKFGAIYGKGNGIQGNTYGIPTKDGKLRILSVIKIKQYIDEFIKYVRNNKNKQFLVTKIGCGLSRYKESDIAPLFKELINDTNVSLPLDFIKIIKK